MPSKIAVALSKTIALKQKYPQIAGVFVSG